MPLDILTIGEALVKVMRIEVGQPFNRPGLFVGPYPSGDGARSSALCGQQSKGISHTWDCF